MKRPRIHVILPVHNRINVTKVFVNCLRAQSYQNFHLILIDDGCTDGTAAFVSSNIKDTHIIYGNGNLWWAGSLNKAFRYICKANISDDEIVWIANDDTHFEADYFERLVCDELLTKRNLVVSPGKCDQSDFIEYGFGFDWENLVVTKLKKGEEPDAITTRGLYMYVSTFKAIGGFPYHLVPHYLSDLEYTIRAKRKGFNLVVSKATAIFVNRSTTGLHAQTAESLLQFFYDNLISKKSAYNVLYWGNFVLLAAPKGRKYHALKLVYFRFYKKLLKFIRDLSLKQNIHS